MKKSTCVTFESVLGLILQRGITTKAALMADQQLYANFWLAAHDFATFCLFSKNGKTTKTGKQLSGNNTKVDILEARGITTREDITMDCVVRMVEYAENMLQKPTVAYMKNYAYSIVNSVVNTFCRSLPPDNIKIVPFNGTIEGTSVDVEDAYTYEDCIPDYTYAPDRVFSEKETVKELEKELKAKQARELAARKAKEARELAEKKELILSEISRLSTHPTEVFVRLSWHLCIKTRDLAARIINDGYEKAFAQLIIDISSKYDIDLEDIRSIITVSKLTKESYKKDKGLERFLSKEKRIVADQISKYKNRAKGHLDNHVKEHQDDQDKEHMDK